MNKRTLIKKIKRSTLKGIKGMNREATHNSNPKLKLRLKKFRDTMLSESEDKAKHSDKTRWFAYWPRMVSTNVKLKPGEIVRIISKPHGDTKNRLVRIKTQDNQEHTIFFNDLTY